MEEKKQVTGHKISQLKILFGSLTEKNTEVLSIINKLCLPVIYTQDFYLALALDSKKYCRLGSSMYILSLLQGHSDRRDFV